MQESSFPQIVLTCPNSQHTWEKTSVLHDNIYLVILAQIHSHYSLNLARFLGTGRRVLQEHGILLTFSPRMTLCIKAKRSYARKTTGKRFWSDILFLNGGVNLTTRIKSNKVVCTCYMLWHCIYNTFIQEHKECSSQIHLEEALSKFYTTKDWIVSLVALSKLTKASNNIITLIVAGGCGVGMVWEEERANFCVAHSL